MFSLWDIVEVIFGLAFMYLVLSLIASWINEWIAHRRRQRGTMLDEAIARLISNNQLKAAFDAHGFIISLGEMRGDTQIRKPSYIPPETFADALIGVLFPGSVDLINAKKAKLQETIDESLAKSQQGGNQPSKNDIRYTVREILRLRAPNITALRSELAALYERKVDGRLPGTYKRLVASQSLVIGIFLAVVLNVDSLVIANELYTRQSLRQSTVTFIDNSLDSLQPQETQEEFNVENMVESIGQIQTALRGLQLPIGWTEYSPNTSRAYREAETEIGGIVAVIWLWASKFLGWFLTGLAVSQGAPFWFDVLGKLVNVRGAGSPPKQDETTSSGNGDGTPNNGNGNGTAEESGEAPAVDTTARPGPTPAAGETSGPR